MSCRYNVIWPCLTSWYCIAPFYQRCCFVFIHLRNNVLLWQYTCDMSSLLDMLQIMYFCPYFWPEISLHVATGFIFTSIYTFHLNLCLKFWRIEVRSCLVISAFEDSWFTVNAMYNTIYLSCFRWLTTTNTTCVLWSYDSVTCLFNTFLTFSFIFFPWEGYSYFWFLVGFVHAVSIQILPRHRIIIYYWSYYIIKDILSSYDTYGLNLLSFLNIRLVWKGIVVLIRCYHRCANWSLCLDYVWYLWMLQLNNVNNLSQANFVSCQVNSEGPVENSLQT